MSIDGMRPDGLLPGLEPEPELVGPVAGAARLKQPDKQKKGDALFCFSPITGLILCGFCKASEALRVTAFAR